MFRFLVASCCFFYGTALAMEECPSESDTARYVDADLFPDGSGRPGGVRIFYFLAEEFDSSKPTVVFLDGGPGSYTNPGAVETREAYNVVFVHHRGLGCSRILKDFRALRPGPYYTIDFAAKDLEAVRRDLLGDEPWYVYGRSYGTMLAQAYAIDNQDKVSGLILDSAIYASHQVAEARADFFSTFILGNAAVNAAFRRVANRFPGLKYDVLTLAFYTSLNSYGRTIAFPSILAELESSASEIEATGIVNGHIDVVPRYPRMGMAREIACREIYDFATDDTTNYYFPSLPDDCRSFLEFRSPFDFEDELRSLSIRTMIWAGRFDPVTPLFSMQRMNRWISGSLLWVNDFAGHGLIREKPTCSAQLIEAFVSGESDSEILAKMNTTSCQSAPASSFARHAEFVAPF